MHEHQEVPSFYPALKCGVCLGLLDAGNSLRLGNFLTRESRRQQAILCARGSAGLKAAVCEDPRHHRSKKSREKFGKVTVVFYPVSALPELLQPASYLIPSTYIFEGMRAVISTGTLLLDMLGWAIVMNIVYLIVMVWFFTRMFARVKERGAMMRLND